MCKRSWATVMALASSGLLLVCLLAGPRVAKAPAADDSTKKAAAKEGSSKDLFGLTKVWDFHLEISAKDYQAMQPPGGGMAFPGRPGGPVPPVPKPGEPARDSDRSAFGVEFPWAHVDLTAEGKTYKNLGIRYKGNSTYMAAARGLKRSFKIELDHYDDQLRFHGLKTINLHCGVMDQTKGREVLAYSVFRAAGVPTSRTAFAEVKLTVPGKYDKEYVGLYIVVEQVDRTFLKNHFKNNKGLLLKPERLRGLDYLGEDWERYKTTYQPKHDATKAEAQRVIAFAKLVNQANDEQFRKEIGSYLDVDAFLRFLAANALVVNMDSFFTIGHNYYLYLNPETNKFAFIPWDLDLSLGSFAMMGSPDQLMDLSLSRPFANSKLTDRLLAMKDVSEKYQQVLKELAAKCFTKERLLKDVEAIEKTTKEIVAKDRAAATARKEGSGGFGPALGGNQAPDLRTFVDKRTASVVAQLDGKSKGYTPAGFGFGARPAGGGMGNQFAKPLTVALDADKDGKVKKEEFVAGVKQFFTDCDKDKKDKIEEKDLVANLNRILPPPPGGRPPAAGAFGPGNTLARAVVRRADTDKDGKVTLAELLAAAEVLFNECDKEKKGHLEEKEIAVAIGLLTPPPPGFGPPPTRPEEPKKEDKKEDKKP